MNGIDWTEIEKVAEQWTREAGDIVKESLSENIKVEWKSNPDDLVTEMDRYVERFFLEKIQAKYPNHSFLGEEGSGEEVASTKGTVWIIDPIDGTTNFVHQQFNFAISVAVYHNGIGMVGMIYNVIGNEFFSAVRNHGAYLNGEALSPLEPVSLEKAIIGLNAGWLVTDGVPGRERLANIVNTVRGVRSYGSAAIEIAYVAAGRLDGYISMGLSPWDFAAGLVLLHEVGGTYSTYPGEELNILQSSSVFVANPTIHQDILKFRE
ncbi:inositol monophosphatase family protein [Desertibacillus haloalkaliphilus]|uniref:inositol monophosphatase family protein n=1 Tax=Desertibacillus haloalkaliphilus TaxID=1328930 RepID=UPI001C26E33E|nr:inositol monophosphatase family protein [Desertibacillus haloalkaliphilus]MBU8906738.1 inositol monophosphatase family protein [Desertibacillus haloalkaliphilus]